MLMAWISLGGPPFGVGDASSSAQLTQDSGPYHLYLPVVMRPSLPPAELEITQSVQQPGNPVTLVAGRTTLVRYTLTDPTPYSGVEAYLYGSRDGTPLPGSPLSANNNPRTLEPAADRASLGDTFNFDVPPSWASGTVQLWTSANNGSGYQIQEGAVTITFADSDALPIRVVPIAYTCTSGGSGTTTPSGPFGYLDTAAYQLYPVPSTDLDQHAAVAYSGPCHDSQPNPDYDGGDWDNMLHVVRDVWIAEGSPNRYYYGLVNSYCGGTCIAGLGYIGWYKAAVGWNGGSQYSASETHAHELGHNHGLPHAPGCGAGNPDPSYPYANGLIGDFGNPNFGYDIVGGNLRAYTSYYDFMTYCGSTWISDYNYERLYTHQQAQASLVGSDVSAPQDVLLVSGTVKPDGSVDLTPAYRLNLRAAGEQSGPYTLELVDQSGTVLAEQSFGPTTSSADGIGGKQGGQEVSFAVTLPYQDSVDRIRVTRDELVLGELAANPRVAGAPFVPLQARAEADHLVATWSELPGASYLVRLSLDGGISWQVVGVNLRTPTVNIALAGPADDLLLEILASDGVHTRRIRTPVSR